MSVYEKVFWAGLGIALCCGMAGILLAFLIHPSDGSAIGLTGPYVMRLSGPNKLGDIAVVCHAPRYPFKPGDTLSCWGAQTCAQYASLDAVAAGVGTPDEHPNMPCPTEWAMSH